MFVFEELSKKNLTYLGKNKTFVFLKKDNYNHKEQINFYINSAINYPNPKTGTGSCNTGTNGDNTGMNRRNKGNQ